MSAALPQRDDSDAGRSPSSNKKESVSLANSQYDSRRYRDETARNIAGRLIWILVSIIAVQYGFTMWSAINGKTEGLEQIEKLFSTVLPVVSGFVGAAVTYYFTKDRP